MSRFDRYLTAQYLAVFGFFALVLVMVYWVNRAVGLFDRLIGDGQSALVFLEFSLLTLPNVIRIVLPVAAFAAAVHVTNRLSQDGELVVMRATGFSSFRMARPVAIFGLLVAGMMSMLTHFAVPAARGQLADRSAEIEANATARLLSDGRFMHPADGLTFYIRAITPQGELQDIFLADDRPGPARTTYTARRALLVRGEDGPKLIMFDGMTQRLDRVSGRLAVTHFSDFTYDVGALIAAGRRAGPTVDELPTRALIAPTEALIAATGASRAVFLAEGHSRFAQPLLAPAAALIGFAALMLGAFSRFGLWRQILFSIVLLILVQMAGNAANGAALRNAAAWPLVYAGPLFGFAVAGALLWVSERPRRRPRGAVAVGTAGA
ncbi:MAG TPA: LPS export ABC transporter permease LptF [Paracoccaceae bacterium]|nr:LPS export ABC transporter permease LptF [Paracoccaceae bacterium]HMO71603.1 LPS export ABC transporter permease LptF [Paracoccaceae bacterium]